MFADKIFLCCLLAVLVINFENIRADDGVTEECGEAILAAVRPVRAPYIGLNEDEALEKVKEIPLTQHCSDWNSAMANFRKLIGTGVCESMSSTLVQKFRKLVEVYDFGSKYICTTHFDKSNKHFRCLISKELAHQYQDLCSSESEDICQRTHDFHACAVEFTVESCGTEASTIVSDLFYKFSGFVTGTECEPLHRTQYLGFLMKLLLRK